MFTVGEEVRVAGCHGAARIGTISIVNEREGTFDVIFGTGKHGDEEESDVPYARISRKEAFEAHYESLFAARTAASGEFDPFDVKDKGNLLFGLQDFGMACRYYHAALRLLLLDSTTQCEALTSGTDVLVQSSQSKLRYLPATIVCPHDSSEGPGHFEVEYDDPDCEETEAAIRPQHQLTPLAPWGDRIALKFQTEKKESRRQLQRSLYVNLARTHMKLTQPGWAIKYCSLAIGVAESLQSSNDGSRSVRIDGATLNKYFADALFIRAKAFLLASRPQLAKKDAIALRSYDPSKSQQLVDEADKLRSNTQKLNRKLVASVMSWVDSSLQSLPSDLRMDDLLGAEDEGDDISSIASASQSFQRMDASIDKTAQTDASNTSERECLVS